MRPFVLFSAVAWLIAGTAVAGEPCKLPAACGEAQACGSPNCCGRCGCSCACEKFCRVVCEMKEVKKTCWVVKCQDFCAPLPGCKHGCCERGDGGEPCPGEAGCPNDCHKKCNPCAGEEKKCFVPPKCGKVRERKVLEKKEVICRVPSYKCVVVYCCPQCGADFDSGGRPAPPPGPAPAKPLTPPPPPVLDKNT
jgi:hypothetical protein